MTLQQLRFPAIPRDQRKNIKLTTNDIASIRRLYNVGIRIKSLADAWRVTYGSIKYWVDEDTRTHQLQQKKLYDKTQYEYNPEYKKKKAQNRTLLCKARYANEPAFRAYYSMQRKTRKENMILVKFNQFQNLLE